MGLQGRGLRRHWCNLSVGLFLVALNFFSATSPARSKPPSACANLLSKSYSALELRSTPHGKLVYDEIVEAMKVNPITYSDLNQKMRQTNPNISEVLEFMVQDRTRLLALLNQQLARLDRNDSSLYWLIEHTSKQISQHEQADANDDQQIHEFIEKYGRKRWRVLADGQADWSEEIENIVRNYYLKNYCYISELLTALEVKGLVSSGDHINQMISPAIYAKLERKLTAMGQPTWVYLELDAVAMDHERGVLTWFEVKHANKRVPPGHDYWFKKIKKRTVQLNALKAVIEADPELRAAFADKIEVRFVIRGAGVSPEAQEQFRRELGVEVEDGTTDGFNAQFGNKRYARAI